MITSYFDNSPRFSFLSKSQTSQNSLQNPLLSLLNLSGLVSLFFLEHAGHKPTSQSLRCLLECSSPRYPLGPSPISFNSLLKYYFLNRFSPDHPFNLYSCPKRFSQSSLPFSLYMHSRMFYSTYHLYYHYITDCVICLIMLIFHCLSLSVSPH